MADVHSKKVRSYNMSQVKGKDTKPEMLIRKYLFAKGFRYRLHVKALPGKPDIVLPKYKTVVMVHGCFWHGHEGCRYFVVPKTRTEWWLEKINATKVRDVENEEKLRAAGWEVIVIFECELKVEKRGETLRILVKNLSELSILNELR